MGGWTGNPSVARNRKIGTQGYCMGGPIAFRTAAAMPDRVGAVASFHGGGLATDMPNSPHLQAAKTKAQFLIAIAQNDDTRSPNDKNVLKDTFAKANLPAEIEVYPAAHGWCPPDSQVLQRASGRKGVEPSARAIQQGSGLGNPLRLHALLLQRVKLVVAQVNHHGLPAKRLYGNHAAQFLESADDFRIGCS